MTDQAAAARDRLALAARTSISPTASNELPPADCFAAGQLDALIGIGHALLYIGDAIHEHDTAFTGPDGVADMLQALAGHTDRIQSDIAEIARLANHR